MELTAREYSLLEVLLRHPDQVLSREQILSHVWGYDFDSGSNIVELYVRYLRRKLGDGVIETVRAWATGWLADPRAGSRGRTRRRPSCGVGGAPPGLAAGSVGAPSVLPRRRTLSSGR